MEAVVVVVGLLLVLFVVLPIVAIVTASAADKRVRRLESEISALRAQFRSQKTTPPPAEPEPVHAETEPPQDATPRSEAFSRVFTPEPAKEPAVEEPEEFADPWQGIPPAHPTSQPIPEPAPRPSRSTREWEMLIGGNVFNRIGAIAILIGAGLFLKYMFDHNYISPLMLFCAGIAGGFVLLLGGNHFHRTGATVFSQGLIGAGVSILYLSVYGGYNLYHLFPQGPALALMSGVTVIAILQSLLYDSIAVCLLGLAGGFLTPLLLQSGPSAGPSNATGLFSYIVVLDIGLLAVSLNKQSWRAIDSLTLAGTYLVYLLWHEASFNPSLISSVVPFLTIIWALFLALDVYRVFRGDTSDQDARAVVSTLSAVFYYLALYADLGHRYHQWMGIVTLAIGAVYLIIILAMIHRAAYEGSFIARYAVTGVAFLAVATAIQYNGFTLVTLWAVEAAALVWLGVRWRMNSVAMSVLALLWISVYYLFTVNGALAVADIEAFALILNQRFLTCSVLSAALALSAWRLKDSEVTQSNVMRDALNYAWCLLLTILFTVEVVDCFRHFGGEHLTQTLEASRAFVLAVVWTLYSLPLVWLGLKYRVLPALYSGLCMLFLGGCWAALAAVTSISNSIPLDFTAVFNPRSAALIGAIAAALISRTLMDKHKETYQWCLGTLSVFDLGIAILGVELLTVETVFLFQLHQAQVLTIGLPVRYELAVILTLAIIWAAYALGLALLGMRKSLAVYTSVSLCTMIAAVGAVATSLGRYEPIRDFLPVANPRAVAFVVVLLCLLLWQRLMDRQSEELKWPKDVLLVSPVVASLLIFELATVETWDFFRRGIEIGAVFTQVHHLESFRQAMLSIMWLIYSMLLMSYGIWRRMLAQRVLALAVFVFTILKVFLYDLSFLDTLYRIFSFIVLGLILIATSYLYHHYKGLILDEPSQSEERETQESNP